MRRRITLSVVALVAGTLLLASIGSVLLVRRAADTNAENQIASDARAAASTLNQIPAGSENAELALIRPLGGYDRVAVIGLAAGGRFGTPLPSPLVVRLMHVHALLAGNDVEGHVGNVLFAVVPLALDPSQQAQFLVARPDQALLVVTRTLHDPVNGLIYFVAVAVLALVVATAVAAWLAGRVTRPLVQSIAATRRIADGDLQARVAVDPEQNDELADLGRTINSMAESLGRSRNLERQFLLSVSHELRTPLTSIRGYTEAIAEGATDDVQEAVGVIAAEARRLERLVGDLLDLARIDAKRFSLDMASVDAADIVRAVAEGFRPEADRAGISLSLRVDPGPLVVEADADRLGQIVANLLENACKFASTRIEVGVRRSDDGSCALWVDDDGPGIPATELPRVFDRHYRSDRSPTRRLGSGLGLAIVAELTSAMGATVRAESPVDGGRGTRLVLWLPPLSAPDSVPGIDVAAT